MIDIKAYLFDLDGTLVDSEILWVQAICSWLRAQGLDPSREQVMDWVYGRAWRDIYRQIIDRYPSLGLTLEAMEQALRPSFAALNDAADTRIQSSVRLLARLASCYPVAIVTGSPRYDAEVAIDRIDVRRYLRFMLTSEDYAPGKPDPAGFLLAARRLQCAPGKCLVFEDSAAGVQAAKSAGMYCVALARPGRPRQELDAADLVLPDLAAFSSESGLILPDTD